MGSNIVISLYMCLAISFGMGMFGFLLGYLANSDSDDLD